MVSKLGTASRSRPSASASRKSTVELDLVMQIAEMFTKTLEATQTAHLKALEESYRAQREALVEVRDAFERLTSALARGGQAKAEMDARTERRARAMLDEAASLAPARTKADAELADQLSEKARVAWTKNGLLIPSTKLAEEWGITRGALDQAEEGYEVFLLKIRGRLWAPAVFAKLKRSAVAKVCRTMPSADEVSKLFFWMQPHGALGRKTPAQAIQAGQLERVLEIARGLAEENGWAHAEAA